MTADKPTKSKVKTNNKKSRNNNGKSKNNKKKSKNNKNESKKSKVNPKNSQVNPKNSQVNPKNSQVKFTNNNEVEPEAVYYKTKRGYYYKQTQNGGSLRVSEAEYMEGGVNFFEYLPKSFARGVLRRAQRSRAQPNPMAKQQLIKAQQQQKAKKAEQEARAATGKAVGQGAIKRTARWAASSARSALTF